MIKLNIILIDSNEIGKVFSGDNLQTSGWKQLKT
jgi:hypothetical protein